MFGFYFLLVFVGATIPAGIWGKFTLEGPRAIADAVVQGRR